jgi:hypothetical protein
MKAISTLTVKRCACRAGGQGRQRVADFLPVDDDHRQDGAGLDRDVEDLGLLVVEAQQRARQDQVPVDEIGRNSVKPLDHAHHGRLDQQNNIHARS